SGMLVVVSMQRSKLMARQSVIDNREIMEAALVGYQSQLSRIDEAIAGIRSRLGVRGPRPIVNPIGWMHTAPPKRKMSAAARKRIGAATRRRWQKYRKAKAQATAPAAKPKRKI